MSITDMEKVNQTDIENCEACFDLKDLCAFHLGVTVGWEQARNAVAKVLVE